MSKRPHWYTARQPDATWNEADAARFDGGRELWMADPIKIGVDHPHYQPPPARLSGRPGSPDGSRNHRGTTMSEPAPSWRIPAPDLRRA